MARLNHFGAISRLGKEEQTNKELTKISHQCCHSHINQAEPSQVCDPVTAAMFLQATMPLQQLSRPLPSVCLSQPQSFPLITLSFLPPSLTSPTDAHTHPPGSCASSSRSVFVRTLYKCFHRTRYLVCWKHKCSYIEPLLLLFCDLG